MCTQEAEIPELFVDNQPARRGLIGASDGDDDDLKAVSA